VSSAKPQTGSEHPLEAALAASSQCLWEWNLATGKLERAIGFRRLLGYSDADPSLAGNWLELVHPADRAIARRRLEDHLAGRAPRFEAELRLLKSDGEPVRVLSRGQVVERDESGGALRLAGAHFDISNRAELEQRLHRARRMETVGLFADGIAHDFNNLLTVIVGYGELLAHHPLPDLSREFLGPIRSAGAIAASLVRRLLAFSSRRTQDPAPICLNNIVGELGGIFQRLLPDNIQVTQHLDPRLGLVLADAGSLEQVLMNLVLNARDAMPEGGHLEIETGNWIVPPARSPQHPNLPPGRYVLLDVSDTGVGIDETTRERLFEPFHTTKPAGAGTGLGLATVYGIVKQAGGWISVSSEKGAGTAFRIFLPRVEGEIAPPPPPPPDEPETGDETILVVENDLEVRRFMRSALRGLGYTVAEAGSHNEAAAVFQKLSGRIDLLIADIALPDGKGTDTAHELSALRPGFIVLFTSGYGEPVPSAGERPLNFLAKPFTGHALGLKVREVLRERKPRRVLVVENDPEAARFVVQALEPAGIEVLLASNEKSALAILERQTVDLALADLSMPEREGIETIIALRKSQPLLPVIAMSADPGEQPLKIAVALGARHAIRKPFSAAALIDLVQRTLNPA